MTRLYSKNLKCPCCKLKFETRALLSSNAGGPRTTDLRALSIGAQSFEYQVHTCPRCGYSGSEGDFEKRKLNRLLKKLVRENITPCLQVEETAYKYCVPGTKGSRYNVVRRQWVFAGHRYEYAAKLAEWRGDPCLSIAYYYLKAAWCYCDRDRIDEERVFRKKAIDWFEAAVRETELKAEDLITCSYLIAENYRRIGSPDIAAEWYDRTIQIGADRTEPHWLAKLATRQKVEPKEFLDDLDKNP